MEGKGICSVHQEYIISKMQIEENSIDGTGSLADKL